MITTQKIIGFLLIVIGLIGIYIGSLIAMSVGIVGGFVLLSLTKIIEILQEINHKNLGLPLTNKQIKTIIGHSKQYFITSNWFEVHPKQEAQYPLIVLDGEQYIRAIVFYKYLSQIEYEYTFSLPDHESTVLDRSDIYYPGVDLFEFGDQVFVKISKLDLKLKLNGNTLHI